MRGNQPPGGPPPAPAAAHAKIDHPILQAKGFKALTSKVC
jgi:hypothetical protein